MCVFVSRESVVIPGDVAEWHRALPDCFGDQYDDAVILLCCLVHQSGIGVNRQRWTIPDLHLHWSQVTIIIIKISVVLCFFCLHSVFVILVHCFCVSVWHCFSLPVLCLLKRENMEIKAVGSLLVGNVCVCLFLCVSWCVYFFDYNCTFIKSYHKASISGAEQLSVKDLLKVSTQ